MTSTFTNEPSAHFLDALGQSVEGALVALGLGRNSCIFVARLTIDVLERFGFEATAMPVRAIGLSAGAGAAVRRGVPPLKAARFHPITGAGITAFGYDPSDGGYDGHILVRMGDLFIDQTADQFASAPFRIDLVPMTFRSPKLSQGRIAKVRNTAGSEIIYEPVADTSHEGSKTWGGPLPVTVCAAQAVKRLTDAGFEPVSKGRAKARWVLPKPARVGALSIVR